MAYHFGDSDLGDKPPLIDVTLHGGAFNKEQVVCASSQTTVEFPVFEDKDGISYYDGAKCDLKNVLGRYGLVCYEIYGSKAFFLDNNWEFTNM
tara:strand:+ start:4295 stop:4573 length:279 start_codon:yes stop_codon:yes gene_type:complete